MDNLNRCGWCGEDALYRDYHDNEWGVPLHDNVKLFEFLCLEGAQAGLSWITILRKRARYIEVFDGFNPDAIARYDDRKISALLNDPGIVRNRLKVHAFIKNARACLDMREAGLTLDRYFWDFVDGRPIQNAWRTLDEVPANTGLSDRLSRDLKQRGFAFVGTTICYAFMQATGMVNDHLVDCYRHRQLSPA
ncbi:MAG: DNA-3-methyladenine glycosylase I [Gammaproteobacteria bacterium]|nr:DNA-3-methyladenine glycosylase I [Gammaproteobacteria bacterium]MYJ53136.1 DNA-3-methyladenine glycosylase I [Gammaproteobacteria bacterium]